MDANKKGTRLFLKTVYAGYLVVLLYFLFFSEMMGRTETDALRYNLVPLREIMRYIRYASHFSPFQIFVNLVGNVVAFVPYGYIKPQLAKRRIGVLWTTIHAFFFSLLIECLQLGFRVGAFDVDDILLNTLGGLLGCVIFTVLHRKGDK